MVQGRFASFAGALMFGASAFATHVGAAENSIGVTAAVNPQASGQPPAKQRRELSVGVNVVANERIVTTAGGQAQMLFRDESAFTIGPNSDVVLDEFVYDPNTRTGKIAFSATKGVFRLVGGRISKKTPVTLKTPTSTIGIRGGIALVSVQPGGSTRATMLFGDAMTVESGGVVKRVTRPGFSITTDSANAPPSDPKPASSEDLDATLSALEGGLEAEEDEEDEPGSETAQAENDTNEESEESENEGEGGAEDDGDSGDEGESEGDQESTEADEGAGDENAEEGGPDEGGDDEGGDQSGPDEGGSDEPNDKQLAKEDGGEEGGGDGRGGDEGRKDGDGRDGAPGDEGGERPLATDGGGRDGGDGPGPAEIAVHDVPTDDDVAGSGFSKLGSDGEPAAIAPEPESSFEVAFADSAASEGTKKIADDANLTDSTQSSATDSVASDTTTDTTETTDTTTTDPAPTGLALTSTFSGRVKHGSSAAAGSDDGLATRNLGFSGATISDGVFDAAAGGSRFTINIAPGSGSATSTSNPFGAGTLSGTRFLRADQEFLTYRLTDQVDGHRVFAFAGLPTTVYPTTGATFYKLSDDFIMGSLFPFIPAASAGVAARGTGTNAAIMWDKSQSGTAQRSFGAVVGGKSGTTHDSVTAVFVGEVRTSASGDYIVGKMRGSTRVGVANVLHTVNGTFDTARDGTSASFFGGAQADHFVLQATPGTTIRDQTSVGSVSFHPNAVLDRTSDTLGTRTTRTIGTSTGMNGFAAGLVESDVSGSVSTDFLVNDGSDPNGVSIQTSAETNKILAALNLRSVNGDTEYVYNFGDADVGAFGTGSSTKGNSTFIDDKHFGAVDRATISSSMGSICLAPAPPAVRRTLRRAPANTCSGAIGAAS